MQPSEQPSSSFPGMPSPSPRKNLFTLQRLLPVAAAVVLVATIAGVFYMARGMGSPSRQASGPLTTATTSDSATATDTGTPTDGTVTPGPTPPPTQGTSGNGNPPQSNTDVRVTQNQDERQPCASDPSPYTVTLYNAGNVLADWNVVFPEFVGEVPGGPQPLADPLTTKPYWGYATPQNGTIAPGQTISVAVALYYDMPCGNTLYEATVHLSFPAGGSQPDIPISFGGTGPARYADVELVSGSLNITQPCRSGGVAPAPFTFAFENKGNYQAIDVGVEFNETVGADKWASSQIAVNPPGNVSYWIYAGQTWTVTVSPQAGVLCNGTVYHIRVGWINPDASYGALTLTDTFI